MAVCATYGMAHSAFKAWDQLDQDKALAWHRRQAEKCTGCGIHPEVTDPERGGRPDALRLTSRLCPTCEISDRTAEEYNKNREPGEYRVWVPTNED